MNASVEITPEAISSAEEARHALEAAQNYHVTTTTEYEVAANELKALSGRAKQLEAMRKDLKAPALEQAKRIDDFFREPQLFIEDAKKAIKRALGVFDTEQQRIRQEAERKAQEAARKERERLQREAAKAEEAARKRREADDAKAAKLAAEGREAEAEQKRIQAAEREEQRLRDAEAKRIAAEAAPPAPVVHLEQPKVAGVSKRENWTFEIVDENQIPREYLMPDEKMIRGVVRATKGKQQIPGVRIYAETIIASRSA